MVKPKLKGVTKKKSQTGKAANKTRDKKQMGGRQSSGGRRSRLPSGRRHK